MFDIVLATLDANDLASVYLMQSKGPGKLNRLLPNAVGGEYIPGLSVRPNPKEAQIVDQELPNGRIELPSARSQTRTCELPSFRGRTGAWYWFGPDPHPPSVLKWAPSESKIRSSDAWLSTTHSRSFGPRCTSRMSPNEVASPPSSVPISRKSADKSVGSADMTSAFA